MWSQSMTYKCWAKICLEIKLMIQLTKIYTRTGDKGETSLGDGSRVSKEDNRV